MRTSLFSSAPALAARVLVLSALLPCAALARNTLSNGERLTPGESLTSNNGEFKMTFEPSGQIVVRRMPKVQQPGELAPGSEPSVHWHSGFQGPVKGELTLEMQHDNNLVVYDTVGGTERNPVWNTDTCEAGRSGLGSLVLQDNGELTVMSGADCLWNAMRKVHSVGGGSSRISL